jgi:F-type H+-transporting ATPase subunit epsilon
MADGKLQLTVVTQDRQMLDTTCDVVELPTSRGVLGILPQHTPLIAKLDVGPLVYEEGGRRRSIALTGGGFCEVADNRVAVLTETAEFPADIDVAAAEDAMRDAEARVNRATDESWREAMEDLEVETVRAEVGRSAA